jgi:DNA-directed RNA polymerase sigma subunit (sigma70/sigma32)
MIIIELNKYSKIIKAPKSSKKEENILDDDDFDIDLFNDNKDSKLSIIRLDSINPQTEDNYFDNVICDNSLDEFIIEDESLENIERNTSFKLVVEKAMNKLSLLDKRIIMKKYGIDLPYQLSINEIAESEGLTPNKVKYIISNAQKIIMESISPQDKQTIIEMLK